MQSRATNENKDVFVYPYPRSYFSEWCHVPTNIRQQDHAEKSSMCCVVQCIRRRNQARVKNTDLRHLSCTVVMQRPKSASPVLSVLTRVGLRTVFCLLEDRSRTKYSVMIPHKSSRSRHLTILNIYRKNMRCFLYKSMIMTYLSSFPYWHQIT